ncbi:hypothetical protein L6452_37196 [Arctium lappa]|uniref:Uncharacterized protein n=1 Tax=Arctium lappa TaxID=4217 RepID=A0ACB8Y325_ARCLA|nr:hypothetical protein L6452_37196 [Arctium lappa]
MATQHLRRNHLIPSPLISVIRFLLSPPPSSFLFSSGYRNHHRVSVFIWLPPPPSISSLMLLTSSTIDRLYQVGLALSQPGRREDGSPPDGFRSHGFSIELDFCSDYC